MAGSASSEEGDFGFQIAPMVDVVFVLMLFFMAAAGSQVVEKELNLNLPAGQGTTTSTTARGVRVEIEADLVALAEQSWQVYDPEAILEAIRQVHAGKKRIPHEVAAQRVGNDEQRDGSEGGEQRPRANDPASGHGRERICAGAAVESADVGRYATAERRPLAEHLRVGLGDRSERR